MMTDLKKNIPLVLTSIVLLSLAGWTLYDGWRQRPVDLDDYTYSEDEAERLKNYPKVQYAHGLRAWSRQDNETAARFFRQAVCKDVLHIDSWIRLAEAEAALRHSEKAQDILAFATDSTETVYRWKWPQMLLARELGMEEVVDNNANYLLSHGVLIQDTLQFLHTDMGGNVTAVISVLNEAHLDNYLDWLMNWSMVEESLTVWRTMAAIFTPEKKTALQFANFLLHNKRITESRNIWQKYTGVIGMTNPGFENELTNLGFDWSYWEEKSDTVEVMRINHDTWEGDYALRVNFSGRENISFQHFYQIFPADPETKYRLTYSWKSLGITTDQGPFIEIFGFDKEGLYKTGPMITGTQGWRQVSLEFDMPENSRAAIVRLSRRPSNRFDSKITGTLWLDDFRLEKIEIIENDTQRLSKEKRSALIQQSFAINKNLVTVHRVANSDALQTN